MQWKYLISRSKCSYKNNLILQDFSISLNMYDWLGDGALFLKDFGVGWKGRRLRVALHLGVQTQGAGSVQEVVSGQVAATQLPQACEGLPAMQDAPVINEENLTERGNIFFV